MVDAGIAGVLLFTSVVTPPKLERLAALNARAEGLLVAVDDAGVVDGWRTPRARRAGRCRCSSTSRSAAVARAWPTEAAVALAQRVAAADGLEYAGVQGYNGNHQATVDFAERRAAEARDDGAAARLRRRARGRRPAAADRLRRRHRHARHRPRARAC